MKTLNILLYRLSVIKKNNNKNMSNKSKISKPSVVPKALSTLSQKTARKRRQCGQSLIQTYGDVPLGLDCRKFLRAMTLS